jgi:signal transduction histidine kinase
VTLRASTLAQADRQIALRLDVSDTGIGIALEQHERIFEPFTHADSSITRRLGGTGFGLSIVRHLVDMMSGTLTVQSSLERAARSA